MRLACKADWATIILVNVNNTKRNHQRFQSTQSIVQNSKTALQKSWRSCRRKLSKTIGFSSHQKQVKSNMPTTLAIKAELLCQSIFLAFAERYVTWDPLYEKEHSEWPRRRCVKFQGKRLDRGLTFLTWESAVPMGMTAYIRQQSLLAAIFQRRSLLIVYATRIIEQRTLEWTSISCVSPLGTRLKSNTK